MSRLTKYFADRDEYGHNSCHGGCESCPGVLCCDVFEMIKKLAYYEDLEEQGRLITLPCKVGDTIWELDEYPSGFELQPAKVERVALKELAGTDIYYIYLSFPTKEDSLIHCYGFDDFGTILFLTKEEAKAKLVELKGEVNE
jgi:hypothetical protein